MRRVDVVIGQAALIKQSLNGFIGFLWVYWGFIGGLLGVY
jgi:hypothetical protein